MELVYSNHCRGIASRPQSTRPTADVIHKGSSNAYYLIIKHLLGIVVGDKSKTLVTDSEIV